jgi:hypothetical protein
MDIRYPEVGDLVSLLDDDARRIGASACLVTGFRPHYGFDPRVEVLVGSNKYVVRFSQIKEILSGCPMSRTRRHRAKRDQRNES